MTQRTERMLWGATLVLAVLVIMGWRYGTPDIAAPASQLRHSADPVMMFNDTLIANAAEHTTEHNPFRLNRRPANTPFGAPDIPREPPPPPTPSPLSAIALKGIVGGPPWQAVLGGVPGRQNNVVVSTGDTIAGIRVKQVQNDKVVIADKDSAITLTLQRVWQ